MLSDEEILKEVAREMGLEWIDEPGYNTIMGVPVAEYLKNHNIFADDCLDTRVSVGEISEEYEEERFFHVNIDMLDAA